MLVLRVDGLRHKEHAFQADQSRQGRMPLVLRNTMRLLKFIERQINARFAFCPNQAS
jgi:hypothetical protein